MKILIIGSNSLLGKNLYNFYKKKKCDVIVNSRFSLKKITNWKKDIIKNIKKHKPDLIFYCSAAQTQKDDARNLKKIIFTNCEVPCLIAQTLDEYNLSKSKLIFFGTSWEENSEGKYYPVNLYAASKKAAENLLNHYALKGTNIINFKLFDTYEENDKRKKFLNILIKSLIKNEELQITKGMQEINLTHMLDICKGVHVGILESKNWKFKKKGILKFHLGQKKVITIKKLVNFAEKSFNKKSKAIFGALKYRDREPMKTFKKFSTPKNWSPKININSYLNKK